MKRRILNIVMVGILGVASVFTIGQLSVGAQDLPLCHGLQCTNQGDCGSLCFCNTPSGSCIADQS